MKIAFFVETPLQLYNCTKYVLGNHLTACADVYITPKYTNAVQMINIISKWNIFQNVYVLKCRNKYYGYFWAVLGLLMPKLYMRWCSGIGFDIEQKHYQRICLSFSGHQSNMIVAASGCGQVLGMEDGIGSYLEDVFSYASSRRRYWYLRIRKLLRLDYNVEHICLNSPQYYRGNAYKSIEKIPGISPERKPIIHEIFGYKSTPLYVEHHIIYLNQPIADFHSSHRKNEKEIFRCINESVSGDLLVRLHPREQLTDFYGNCQIDRENNMWELLCEEQITDDHVLISMCSTCQFSPKFMYDKEPILIFTYKLYGDLNEQMVRRMEGEIEIIRDAYRDKSRVVVVQDRRELKEVVKKYSDRAFFGGFKESVCE